MAMTRTEIVDKLKEVITTATGNPTLADKCQEDSVLTDDLGLNSVGILFIVIAIEEFFSIRFDDVGFGDFKRVSDVLNYIEKKVNEE
ncbi:MAG: hypothetical protein E7380_06475 [Clostridiales bacterium]|nr:hypothetical protein [Clostridiales bacterium]MBQ2769225.1 hypothetical protein [Clostridia bacterium]